MRVMMDVDDPPACRSERSKQKDYIGFGHGCRTRDAGDSAKREFHLNIDDQKCCLQKFRLLG